MSGVSRRMGYLGTITALTIVGMTASLPVYAQGGSKQSDPPKLTAQQEAAIETAFKAGNAQLEKKQYAAALAAYNKALALAPDDPSILWNSGMAAFFSRNYAAAATLYQRLKAQDPANGRVIGRLIQTYQATGDTKSRDGERDALLALYKSGKDTSDLSKQPSFCREQFTVGDRDVLVYEMFVFKPRATKEDAFYFAVRYNFVVANPDGTLDTRIEVGWDVPQKNADGSFKPGGSYYFDAYYPKGAFSRKTMGLYEQELTYEATRQHILDILTGKVEMSGGTKRPSP